MSAKFVSQMLMPDTLHVDENGPNVMAAEFDADPAGDAPAAKAAVWREQPEPVVISLPDTLVGDPSERLT